MMSDGELALLVDTVESLLERYCDPDALAEAEREGFAPRLWAELSGAGLAAISVPEAIGGSGGTESAALAVLRLAGRYGAPVPLAEHGLLGGWLAAAIERPLPEGPASVVPGHPADDLRLERSGNVWRLSGEAHAVPWGRMTEVTFALLVADERTFVVELPRDRGEVTHLRGLSGEPRDTMAFAAVELADAAVVEAPEGVDRHALMVRGALCRAVQMAGAMEYVSELTSAYARDRVQFGRPIARFQAIQHHLVVIAEEAAVAGIAADLASRRFAEAGGWVEVAAAKVLAGTAADVVTARAHQVHGAIGMTAEYRLHHWTRRLWTWRDEFVGHRGWSSALGREVIDRGADELWGFVCGEATATSAPILA